MDAKKFVASFHFVITEFYASSFWYVILKWGYVMVRSRSGIFINFPLNLTCVS